MPTPTNTPVPTPRPTAIPRPTQDGQYYYNKGWEFYAHKQHEQAIAYLSVALELSKAEHWISDAYSYRASSYIGLGQHQLAIQDLDTRIAWKPKDDGAWTSRGSSYHCLGQYPEAVRNFGQAIQLNLHNYYAYIGRSFAYTALGQHQLARPDKDKAPNDVLGIAARWTNTSGPSKTMTRPSG